MPEGSRSDVAVAVLRAVRAQLLQAQLPRVGRRPAHPESANGPARHTPSLLDADVKLVHTWLNDAGPLDVLHLVYDRAGFPRRLEYRVEMDLQVKDAAGSEGFIRAVEAEAQLIVEEIATPADFSVLTGDVRGDGHLCWGAVPY